MPDVSKLELLKQLKNAALLAIKAALSNILKL